MVNKLILLIAIMLPFISRAQQANIIPQPVSIKMATGSFVIDNNTTLKVKTGNKELQAAAVFFTSYIKNISGKILPVNGAKSKAIELKIAKTDGIGQEGYLLQVTPASIVITANSKAGIVYGMQSLFQTLPAVRTNFELQVPCMNIEDYPRFKWRGMHLDVSRHFFAPELIKEYIDLMSSYKMNTFHWHLVDDQGWRIEIKKYPKLTEVGAWRVDKLDKVWGDRPQAKAGETATYGGFYTQDQIRDIIAYAAQRNITIVPEIEMPGHVASAIASYPELCCTQQSQLPLTGGNYTNMSSNYCAGNDQVFTFLQDVLTEVINLFPSKYIHIGGDEVDKTPWKKCDRCQARIKAEGLKNEEELQSYFIKRMEKFLISKNRKMIGWDEILEGGLAPEATVMSWRGEAGGIQAAKMDHDVVMTPGSPCYFDHYQAGPEGEPMAIGGMNTLKRVYDYEPIPAELNEQQARYVLGAQANLWTEYVTTAEHVEYMILPRMLALAEVVWSPKSAKDWMGFNERLQSHFRAFDQKGLHYSKGDYKVTIKPFSQNGKLMATMSTEALNSDIYYTTNGSEPTKQSTKYEGPVQINASMILKAVTVKDGKVMGVKPSQQSFVVHKANGRDVTYASKMSRYYMADGPNSLTDGIRGTLAVGKYWHGFNGTDLLANIDLGSEQSIYRISLGCLQNYRDWIFMPQYVKFEVSSDGKSYTEVATVNNTIPVNEQAATIKDFVAVFPEQKAKFIRVTAKILDACPKGHSGDGKPAWLFADEIVIQ
ncbi:glycoside hydrolase family 20 protein [Chitinophagaceae bacterium LB-8]|uniref:beta-N-acetylhexosaminidase n=1 Tax=Paraflavisolibacter caeni TaxID=2982496 RepID=A0A9X3BAD3_9BACT|nr:family 20 glycosylhydrolase [Paraflavisolibacter caeni]MCU7552576.1 glycoside hydrolase family 20 protein [Paraflavisolibacter caeni]